MASAFAHALAAVTLGKVFKLPRTPPRLWVALIVCSILPDADVVSFAFDIPYEHVLGHRGITHSLLFALLLGLLVTLLFFTQQYPKPWQRLQVILLLALSTASHGVLDAITNGGLGVAFLAPFDNTRYFFPWRPVQVSPIGIDHFMGELGVRVLASEAMYIGIPCMLLLLGVAAVRLLLHKQ